MIYNHRVSRVIKVLLDSLFLAGIYCAAFIIRFEGSVPERTIDLMLLTLPYVVCVKMISLAAYRIHRMTWRYVALPEAKRICMSLLIGSSFLFLARLTLVHFSALHFLPPLGGIPLGVLLIDLLLSWIVLITIRVGIRLWTEKLHQKSGKRTGRKPIPTILIGAERAGAAVAKQLATQGDCEIEPLGFVDNDIHAQGTLIHGCSVLGTVDQLAEIVRKTGAKQALITMPDAPGKQVRHIVDLCEQCGISTKIIPELRDIVNGKINLSRIRDVAIEDILRRDPVRLDCEAIAARVKDRMVLITGAGGSIGSELCRKVCGFNPSSVVLVEQAENSLFHIHWELSECFPGIELIPCVADICDEVRMDDIFSQYKPYMVFHAAAHKHVPMMEWNPSEAVKNNVLGTKVVADMAHGYGCASFVMISTDKAVRPTSVMGLTKRVAEIYIQTLSQRSKTKFVAVRFGNVLGSNGSVVPIFKQQISKGGPVTVTHPKMQRYFMTIPEACELVLQAATMSQKGELFILDMGEPVKIVDLARELIKLSGLVPDQDIEIKFTGVRPGEKLFEELSLGEEQVDKTAHPRIFIGRLKRHDWDRVHQVLAELRELIGPADKRAMLAKLKELVPEYQGNEEQPCHVGAAELDSTPLENDTVEVRTDRRDVLRPSRHYRKIRSTEVSEVAGYSTDPESPQS